MTQKNSLYDITHIDGSTLYLRIKPDHAVYQGHFPGNPITPGVLTLQMVRECVNEIVGGSFRYSTIKKCRFLALTRPNDTLKLQISTEQSNGAVSVNAVLSDAKNESDVRLQLEAELR